MIATFSSFAAFAQVASIEERPSETLLEVAGESGVYSTFLQLVDEAGFIGVLKGDKKVSVFAPTDDAFSALPEGVVEELLAPKGRPLLQRLIQFHIVRGDVLVSDLDDVRYEETLEGGEIEIDSLDKIYVEDAVISQPDQLAGNGVLHGINAVIVPRDLVL